MDAYSQGAIITSTREVQLMIYNADTGSFRRFSTSVRQNVCINSVRHTMVCNAYYSFSKIL